MKKEKWLLEQEAFEKVIFSEDDSELHSLIFKAISEESELKIPHSFSSKIVQKKIRQETIWQDVKAYAFYAALFLVLVFVGIAFISFDSSPNGRAILSKLAGNLFYFALAALGYFLIQTLDRVFVKGRNLV